MSVTTNTEVFEMMYLLKMFTKESRFHTVRSTRLKILYFVKVQSALFYFGNQMALKYKYY